MIRDIDYILEYIRHYVTDKSQHDSEPMLNWKDLETLLDYIKELNNNKFLLIEYEEQLNKQKEVLYKIKEYIAMVEHFALVDKKIIFSIKTLKDILEEIDD